MKKSLLTLSLLAAISLSSFAQSSYRIDFKGNSYTTKDRTESLYFRNDSTGSIDLTLVGQGSGQVEVFVLGRKFKATFDGQGADSVKLGSIKTKTPGYIKVDVRPLSGKVVDLLALRVSGAVSASTLSYVHDFLQYWGSRGPSVHLKYTMPSQASKWVYNEVTVPKDQDVIGSYYMANGFGEGYFGMQCNSDKERRVLFSVWSPFVTDDPKSIPQDEKIIMVRKGPEVRTGEFGNEGSGGQSFLRYPWVAGNTYKFLTSVEPDGKGATLYTAYFYAPEQGQWRLIASFLRPKTSTNYTNAHSFLENFIPSQGYLPREVHFANQWACGVDGVWREMTGSMFTYDATAAAGVRKDYAGGVTAQGDFFLKNCGFFDQNTPYRAKFTRPDKKTAPVIDFEALEKL